MNHTRQPRLFSLCHPFQPVRDCGIPSSSIQHTLNAPNAERRGVCGGYPGLAHRYGIAYGKPLSRSPLYRYDISSAQSVKTGCETRELRALERQTRLLCFILFNFFFRAYIHIYIYINVWLAWTEYRKDVWVRYSGSINQAPRYVWYGKKKEDESITEEYICGMVRQRGTTLNRT